MRATAAGARGDRLDLAGHREMISVVLPAWATAGAVTLMVWLLREIARRRDVRPPPDLVPAPRTEGTKAGTGSEPYAPASIVASLAVPTGVGVVGPGANAYMRALLVELLTGGICRVVISRNELQRLFEGDFDQLLQQAFARHLYVSELLEDAIEHLELQLLMGEAAQANPDLVPPCGHEQPVTYWIATPGHDDDVVFPLLRRAPRLLGIMFGEWRHGPTCVLDATGTIIGVYGAGDASSTSGARLHGLKGGGAVRLVTPTLTPSQALARLRAYASTARTAR